MVSFREVTLSDAQQILNWRTKDRVTRFMYSDIEHDLQAQQEWLKNSFNRQDYYHWIIQSGGHDVGFLNFSGYDPIRKKTSWGFYLGEDNARGIGGRIPPLFYSFAFDTLGVEVITVTVFHDNRSTIRLHLTQGYTLNPAQDCIIKKNGKDIQVIGLKLKKEIFETSKYRRFKAYFPIEKWRYKHLINKRPRHTVTGADMVLSEQ